jgi:hypothetical protein
MVGFKPIPFSQLPTSGQPLIDGLMLGFDFLLSLGTQDGYVCGHCRKPFYVDKKGSSRPEVCSYCEQQIDWVGIKIRQVKVCPRGDYETPDLNKVVCPYHFPVARLEVKEIPI